MSRSRLRPLVFAARVLRAEEEIRSVTLGKRADLVAVEGNPLPDPSVLLEVAFVMKDGVVYRQ